MHGLRLVDIDVLDGFPDHLRVGEDFMELRRDRADILLRHEHAAPARRLVDSVEQALASVMLDGELLQRPLPITGERADARAELGDSRVPVGDEVVEGALLAIRPRRVLLGALAERVHAVDQLVPLLG